MQGLTLTIDTRAAEAALGRVRQGLGSMADTARGGSKGMAELAASIQRFERATGAARGGAAELGRALNQGLGGERAAAVMDELCLSVTRSGQAVGGLSRELATAAGALGGAGTGAFASLAAGAGDLAKAMERLGGDSSERLRALDAEYAALKALIGDKRILDLAYADEHDRLARRQLEREIAYADSLGGYLKDRLALDTGSYEEELTKRRKLFEDFYDGLETIGGGAARAMSSSMSDLFFDAIRGEMDDISDYFDSFLKGMTRAVADAAAEMAATQMVKWAGLGLDMVLSSFHTGVVNLKEDELLSVLQKDETVIPAKQAKVITDVISGGSDPISKDAYFDQVTGLVKLGSAMKSFAFDQAFNIPNLDSFSFEKLLDGKRELGAVWSGLMVAGTNAYNVFNYVNELGQNFAQLMEGQGINISQDEITSLALDQAVATGVSSLGGGIVGYFADLAMANMGVSDYSIPAKLLGTGLGFLLGGPLGSMVGTFAAPLVSLGIDGLADVMGLRSNESFKDALERVFGEIPGRAIHENLITDLGMLAGEGQFYTFTAPNGQRIVIAEDKLDTYFAANAQMLGIETPFESRMQEAIHLGAYTHGKAFTDAIKAQGTPLQQDALAKEIMNDEGGFFGDASKSWAEERRRKQREYEARNWFGDGGRDPSSMGGTSATSMGGRPAKELVGGYGDYGPDNYGLSRGGTVDRVLQIPGLPAPPGDDGWGGLRLGEVVLTPEQARALGVGYASGSMTYDEFMDIYGGLGGKGGQDEDIFKTFREIVDDLRDVLSSSDWVDLTNVFTDPDAQKFSDLFGVGGSGMDQVANDWNDQFDEWKTTLEELNASEAELAKLEEMRIATIEAAQQAMRDEMDQELTLRELRLAGDDAEIERYQQQLSQARELQEAVATFGDGSAEVERLIAVQGAETAAMEDRIAAEEAAAEAERVRAEEAARHADQLWDADARVQALRLLGFEREAEWADMLTKQEEQLYQARMDGLSKERIRALKTLQLLERIQLKNEQIARLQQTNADIQIRYLNATGQSLDAALMQFDIDAAQQYKDALKQGADLALLDKTLWLERQAIIKSYQEQELADAESHASDMYQAQSSAYDYLIGVRQNITGYLEGLEVQKDAPHSNPLDRLASAQSQFDKYLDLARRGDRDALDAITGYADTLLSAGQDVYASTGGYQDIYQYVTSMLSALPDQVPIEQLILGELQGINASTTTTAAATTTTADNTGSWLGEFGDYSAYFEPWAAGLLTSMDKSADMMISPEEWRQYFRDDTQSMREFLISIGAIESGQHLTNDGLMDLYNAIDTNGDGQLSALELMEYQTKNVADALTTDSENKALGRLGKINTFSMQTAERARAIRLSSDDIRTGMRQAVQLLGGAPGFESGGFFSGGLARVHPGEMIYTGPPAFVASAANAAAMAGGAAGGGESLGKLLAEFVAFRGQSAEEGAGLRRELAHLVKENRAIRQRLARVQ